MDIVSVLAKVGYAALACIAIGLLIGVHEFGHFISAKLIGVRVDVFSIGFWKALASWKVGETEYKICIIPLGGYVKLAGEERPTKIAEVEAKSEEEGEPVELPAPKPDEFFGKPWYQRIIVFAAGATMNIIFGMLAFIVAYAVGVPFVKPLVGDTDVGSPAWSAGIRRDDLIVEIGGRKEPDFEDVLRSSALTGQDEIVPLKVERNGKKITYSLSPKYYKEIGISRLGIYPTFTARITGLAEVETADEPVSPAKEAGLQAGDVIVSVEGRKVESSEDVVRIVRPRVNQTTRLTYEREGKQSTTELTPIPTPSFVMGVSCVGTTIEKLAEGGRAWQLGLRPGDRITHVDSEPMPSVVDIKEKVIEQLADSHKLTVKSEGGTRDVTVSLDNPYAPFEFLDSFRCKSHNILTWVQEDSPAWKAGLRRGDVILEVEGEKIEDWEEFLLASGDRGKKARRIKYQRDEKVETVEVTPEWNFSSKSAVIGVVFNEPVRRKRRYLGFAAVSEGLYKTYLSFKDLFRTLRGLAVRRLHPKHMGGIIMITSTSYQAAEQGIGRLLYMAAIISIGLGFLNLLPIPVLDGGHIAFTLVEAVRGKPVPPKIMAGAQYVGLALLLFLVFYVTKNDILRLFPQL